MAAVGPGVDGSQKPNLPFSWPHSLRWQASSLTARHVILDPVCHG